MRKPHLTRLLAAVLTAALLASSCGGGGDAEQEASKGEGCPEEMILRATYLPSGFDDGLKEGPGGGKDPVPKIATFHYEGGSGKYIELFRGGQRTKFKAATKLRALGRTVRMNKIPGGYAAKMRLGLGSCSRYQIEGIGVSEGDFKKVITGLRRVPVKQS